MNRDRAYLRKQRKKKIKQRKELMNDLTPDYYIYPKTTHGSKCNEVLSGDKDGYLSDGGFGFLSHGTSKKTNTRKGHASYRHSGAYGEANQYSIHDQKQIDSMEQDLDEWNNVSSDLE